MGIFPKDRDLSLAPDRVQIEVRASDLGLRPADVAIRLDNFLCRYLHWRSRTSVQNLIRDGFVEVALPTPERPGGPLTPRVEKRGGKVLPNATLVTVHIPPELRIPEPSDTCDGELSILLEDDEVVAVDKPSGLAVHPSGRHLVGTLIQRVHARYRGDEANRRLPIRLCHRLDRETSGIVLIAKGNQVHRSIMRQFERRQVEKEYFAICHGAPEKGSGRIDLPLGPATASRIHLKISVNQNGLPSVTHWRVLRVVGSYCLLACRLETGRQHQIRVHLAAIGHPIVGDKLYGPDDEIFLRASAGELTETDYALLELPRHALHNHRLVWKSPTTGRPCEVVSSLAADLDEFLETR
jgi:23S rRNA pseudouridine1911/1915/1917 synthase